MTAPAIIAGTVLWGITFGWAAAQLQAALTTTGGAESDVANSFLPVRPSSPPASSAPPY